MSSPIPWPFLVSLLRCPVLSLDWAALQWLRSPLPVLTECATFSRCLLRVDQPVLSGPGPVRSSPAWASRPSAASAKPRSCERSSWVPGDGPSSLGSFRAWGCRADIWLLTHGEWHSCLPPVPWGRPPSEVMNGWLRKDALESRSANTRELPPFQMPALSPFTSSPAAQPLGVCFYPFTHSFIHSLI